MAKIKHTKNELKTQKDALSRFQRYLPMLQLKKQQLQSEIQRIEVLIFEKRMQEDSLMQDFKVWIGLLADSFPVENYIKFEKAVTSEGNIAGVAIPLLNEIEIHKESYALFDTPPWLDDAVNVLEQLINLRVEREILDQQRLLIIDELRVTTQRVNLFEKVKIPECKENIRVIRIFLGDEQTAAVARGKIAKKRTEHLDAERDVA